MTRDCLIHIQHEEPVSISAALDAILLVNHCAKRAAINILRSKKFTNLNLPPNFIEIAYAIAEQSEPYKESH